MPNLPFHPTPPRSSRNSPTGGKVTTPQRLEGRRGLQVRERCRACFLATPGSGRSLRLPPNTQRFGSAVRARLA